jgi:Na+-translocating ferredoxin:NAD+ oxidoreductase RNF subunit RnfB
MGVKVFDVACRGCVNCIRSCPTEAIRVIDGMVKIIPELCIDCGECIRSCGNKALGLDEDDWRLLQSHGASVISADPTFYVQFSHYWRPALVVEALASWNILDLHDWVSRAFDVAAYAIARVIEGSTEDERPFISTYCPSVVRLIQTRFPELLGRLVPVESPLETGVALWRKETGRTDPVTLLSPCPAKITMVRNPEGRESSNIDHVVSVKSVARDLLAGGPRVRGELEPMANTRWIRWAVRGGESRHIKAFSSKEITTVTVSGLRNTLDLLRDLELGRLHGVDFVECRVCDLGCIGGIGNAESRFLGQLRTEKFKVNWDPSEEERAAIVDLYEEGVWRLPLPLTTRPGRPLADNLNEAMERLKKMKEVYADLPHIDCGACGRPSCKAMAEDVVRGLGETTDCIFKLRERISTLAAEIIDLSRLQPQTLRGRGKLRS